MRIYLVIRNLILLAAAFFIAVPVNVFAINATNRNALGDDIIYYWANQAINTSCSTTSTTAGTPVNSAGNSTWNSGLAGPYYLEQFVIEVLKDLAAKEGVPQTSAVTQEHVVALVGWAYAEGGNITNTGAFNPWNSGLTSRPDLVNGATSASGVQSYISFDAGVEANAIVMTGTNQSRIGTILTQPASTAEQVDHAIAYPDESSPNQAWAWGPTPGDYSSVLAFNHTVYINTLLNVLSTTRQNYSQYASVEIGPGQENTNHVATSLLKYGGGSGNINPTGGTTGSCTGGGGTGTNASGCGGGGKYSALVDSNASFAGTDQGIDFVPANPAGYNICAPEPGTITLADQTGHTFNRTSGTAEIIEQLDQPPNAPSSSQFIYYAEIIQIDPNIHVGVHVDKGNIIGHNAQSPGIEVGWAPSATRGFMCAISYPSPCGTSFGNWIVNISAGGAP
jgi:hypothetical protein